MQKQRLMNKYDGNNIAFNTNNQQQNRMHNNPSQYSVEDDLGKYLSFHFYMMENVYRKFPSQSLRI